MSCVWKQLLADTVMEEPLDGFGKLSEHNNNIYLRSEQSLTQDWVVSFESTVGCGLGELKAEMLENCDLVC